MSCGRLLENRVTSLGVGMMQTRRNRPYKMCTQKRQYDGTRWAPDLVGLYMADW